MTAKTFTFAISWPGVTGRPALIEWVAGSTDAAWEQVKREFSNEPDVLIELRG
jgi:hypothetical protein